MRVQAEKDAALRYAPLRNNFAMLDIFFSMLPLTTAHSLYKTK